MWNTLSVAFPTSARPPQGLGEPLARWAHWLEGCLGARRLYLFAAEKQSMHHPAPSRVLPAPGRSPLLGLHWLPLLPGLSVADAHSLGNACMASPPRLPSLRWLG